eukprot:IDg7839t1
MNNKLIEFSSDRKLVSIEEALADMKRNFALINQSLTHEFASSFYKPVMWSTASAVDKTPSTLTESCCQAYHRSASVPGTQYSCRRRNTTQKERTQERLLWVYCLPGRTS